MFIMRLFYYEVVFGDMSFFFLFWREDFIYFFLWCKCIFPDYFISEFEWNCEIFYVS